MKRLSLSLILSVLVGLGMPGAALALDDVMDEDYELFESENWAEDDYGFYDEDFYYGTDDQWYESWYEESDVQNWGQFSAESEEGFFNF